MTLDEEILVALYYAAIKNGAPGGFKISDFLPEGYTFLDARNVAARLLSYGYIKIPQGMVASLIVYITEEGCKRAQSLF